MRVHSHLCCYCVGTCWKKLCNTCCLEPCFSQSKGCSKSCSTSTHNDSVILVIKYCVLACNRFLKTNIRYHWIDSKDSFYLGGTQRLIADNATSRSRGTQSTLLAPWEETWCLHCCEADEHVVKKSIYMRMTYMLERKTMCPEHAINIACINGMAEMPFIPLS